MITHSRNWTLSPTTNSRFSEYWSLAPSGVNTAQHGIVITKAGSTHEFYQQGWEWGDWVPLWHGQAQNLNPCGVCYNSLGTFEPTQSSAKGEHGTQYVKNLTWKIAGWTGRWCLLTHHSVSLEELLHVIINWYRYVVILDVSQYQLWWLLQSNFLSHPISHVNNITSCERLFTCWTSCTALLYGYKGRPWSPNPDYVDDVHVNEPCNLG